MEWVLCCPYCCCYGYSILPSLWQSLVVVLLLPVSCVYLLLYFFWSSYGELLQTFDDHPQHVKDSGIPDYFFFFFRFSPVICWNPIVVPCCPWLNGMSGSALGCLMGLGPSLVSETQELDMGTTPWSCNEFARDALPSTVICTCLRIIAQGTRHGSCLLWYSCFSTLVIQLDICIFCMHSFLSYKCCRIVFIIFLRFLKILARVPSSTANHSSSFCRHSVCTATRPASACFSCLPIAITMVACREWGCRSQLVIVLII